MTLLFDARESAVTIPGAEVYDRIGHHSVDLHPDVLREVALEVLALDEIDDKTAHPVREFQRDGLRIAHVDCRGYIRADGKVAAGGDALEVLPPGCGLIADYGILGNFHSKIILRDAVECSVLDYRRFRSLADDAVDAIALRKCAVLSPTQCAVISYGFESLRKYHPFQSRAISKRAGTDAYDIARNLQHPGEPSIPRKG